MEYQVIAELVVTQESLVIVEQAVLLELGDYLDIITEVAPGVTGLWQVSGRNEKTFKERVILDSWYIQNWSLWLDFVILIRTLKAVFGREGAY